MIGHVFSRLTVLKASGADRKRNLLWLCRCSCGNEVTTAGYRLRSGETRSCGCLQRETVVTRNTSHGESGTRLYVIWANMLARCADVNNPDYGGRGITVCGAWETYASFALWARTHGYDASLTIDRISNDKGYGPENCRWATALEQSRNKRPRQDQKVSDQQVLEILSDTRLHREIAAEYGVRQQHVSRIKSGDRRAFPTEGTHA